MAISAYGSPIYNSATGAAGAATSCALVPTQSRVVYLTGIDITSSAPASLQNVLVTISGVSGSISKMLNFQLVESVGQGGALSRTFPGDGLAGPPGGTITVSVPAVAGGGAVSIVAYGHQV